MKTNGQLTSVLVNILAEEVSREISTGIWTPCQIIASLGLVAASIQRLFHTDDARLAHLPEVHARHDREESSQGVGLKTDYADRLHATKYRSPGETFREAMNRVANALKDDDAHFQALKDILREQRFLPGGRIQAAMGASRNVTAFNCFVSGNLEDSYVDGPGCIMDRAKEAAATMRMGGGIGYDFSTLRPRGAPVRGLESVSSGPVAFMHIFDAVCKATASAGHRRGAQMGVMRIDHPDILEFIRAKNELGVLTGFNVSVGVTDRFMACLETGQAFPLVWKGEVVREVDPGQLWDTLMRATWDYAEPGVLFIDTIARMNNLWYCEEISATNPCGEQPLPAFGACLLGSFNLPSYLSGGEIDWELLGRDIPYVVSAMDNVIDRTSYPLPEQEREAKAKRRMGLGVTGLANAGEAVGFPYGGPSFIKWTERVLAFIRDRVYQASIDLAGQRGAFPLCQYDDHSAGSFVARLPENITEAIYKHGIRNSHLLSIAPTGTISLCADNVSSGIEPVVAYEVDRIVETEEGKQIVRLEDFGAKFLGVRGRTIQDVSVQEHLDVLCTASRFVDSAVSKTINVPSTASWSEFCDVYKQAWQRGAKGCTTFRFGGKREGILQPVNEGSSCYLDEDSGRRVCE